MRPLLAALPVSLLSLLLTVVAQNEGSPQDYAPNVNQSCPDVSATPLVRVFTPGTQTLHPDEASFISDRLSNVVSQAWKDWMGDGSAIGYNMSALTAFGNDSVKIGISISGGGYRAAQYGAGVLSGLDYRNDSAKSAGTGGLLQVASYLSGLSGGSWITGSLYFNDFPTIEQLVFGDDKLSGWLLDIDLATPDGLDLFSDKNQYFYGSLLWSVVSKANKWIDTSITDPWARMISYHFLNQTTRDNFFTNDTAHGAGQLWTHIPLVPSYQRRETPFPLVMADSRPVGSNLTTLLSPDSVVYEITPLEFGSWDPDLSAMMNLTYAGTHLTNGQPDNSTSCVTAFDQAGFMMGTSASLFNQIFDRADNVLESFGPDGTGLLYTLQRQLRDVSSRADDVANWPSPFHGIKNDTFQDSNSKWLELIDGSSNAENVPLGSMFVKARGLDMIVAVDSSADDLNAWPNGSSILFTSSRLSNLLESSHQQFPPLPSNPSQFISTGVRQRPTLFGCNPTKSPPEFPLVLYLPNSPPINGEDPVTNTGTFQIDYTPLHSRLFIDQAHANTVGGFLPKSKSPDPNWGKCLQCAAIDRARFKVSPQVPRSDFCARCFQQYCFDPSNPPDGTQIVGRKLAFVNPSPTGVSKLADFFKDHKFSFIGGFVGLAALISGLIIFLIWRRKRVLRAREAEYKQLDILGEAEWEAEQKPYDPYQQKDLRTPSGQAELNDEDFRNSYASGSMAMPSPEGGPFDTRAGSPRPERSLSPRHHDIPIL